MSKGVKKVLAVVAAVAIPFLAVPIAAAIGLSAAIGGTLAATVVGGALGAGAAAATGNNPLLGAAGGAFGGFMAGGGFGMVKDAFGNITNAVGIGGEGAAGAAGSASYTPAGVSTYLPASEAFGPTPGIGDSGFQAFNEANFAAAAAPGTGIGSSASSPSAATAASAGIPVRPTEFGGATTSAAASGSTRFVLWQAWKRLGREEARSGDARSDGWTLDGVRS